MNPEVLMSFLLMQSLSPAGSTIPPETILTASDDVPAWARFTFQVKTLQDVQAEKDRLLRHHQESHAKLDALAAERAALRQELQALIVDQKVKPELIARLRESGKYPALSKLLDEAAAAAPSNGAGAKAEPAGTPQHHPHG
jgi:hypothetical protein